MEKALDEEIVKKMIICSRYLRHYRHKNMAQDRVIELLGQYGPKMSQKEIQNKLGIRPGSVSELISKLENRGLVIREKSDEDKRTFNIVLTEQGEKAFEEISAVDDIYKGLFSVLSKEECETLNGLLEKLGDDWMNREPAILEEQKDFGAKIIKNEQGHFDVDLSHDYNSPDIKRKR